jgi:hypothetical protein
MIDPTIEAPIAAAIEADENGRASAYLQPDPDPDPSGIAAAKLRDALVTGFEPEFSPHEAEAAGAFLEDALREEEAREADLGGPPVQVSALSLKAPFPIDAR